MKHHIKQKLQLIAVILVLLVLACGTNGETPNQDTEAVEPETSSSEPTAVPLSVKLPNPEPAAGKGNLAGQVRWNDTGAAGIELKICTEFSWFGSCEGTIYSAITDEEGIYFFTDNEPGE